MRIKEKPRRDDPARARNDLNYGWISQQLCITALRPEQLQKPLRGAKSHKLLCLLGCSRQELVSRALSAAIFHGTWIASTINP